MTKKVQVSLEVTKISILSEQAATKYGNLLRNGPLTLEQFIEVTKSLRCQWDGTILDERVFTMPNQNGFTVVGYNNRQNLAKRCKKCKYIWDIQKLGIPVDL